VLLPFVVNQLVTGLIDRFEKKKLVKRKFAEDDRRKAIIEPNTKNIMAL